MAELVYQLVFKRGGETPAKFESNHDTQQKAAQEATREYRRQRAAGYTDVWLAYDVWEVPPRGRMKRIMKDVTLQRPS